MASDRIVGRGVREHNLKNIDREILRLPGSGKSTVEAMNRPAIRQAL